jgi:hypothetical protein
MKFTELPVGKLGEAISYTLNRWPALLVYLDHPFVEISNNASERSIKPMVLSRRDWLFVSCNFGVQAGLKRTDVVHYIVKWCRFFAEEHTRFKHGFIVSF